MLVRSHRAGLQGTLLPCTPAVSVEGGTLVWGKPYLPAGAVPPPAVE